MSSAGEIRGRIGVWRPMPTLTVRETVIDYLVHGPDLAIPLGRSLDARRLRAHCR